jgi:hypothetical protein
MNDRTKKILIWGSVITLVGVGSYLGYRLYDKRKKKKAEEEARKLAETQALIAQQAQQNQGGGGNVGGGGGGVSTDGCPPELNTPEKIKAFQDYMDTVGVWVKGDDGKYKKLLKGNGYGVCGKNTQLAWKTYGTPYQQTQAPSDEANTKPVISENLKKDIDTVVAMGVGEKAKRGYLESGIDAQSKKDWVSSWARALRANKADPAKGTTFVWNTGGQDWGLYEAYSGTKVLGFNPTDRKPKPLSEAYFYEKPEVSSFSFVQATGNNAGTVKGYQYNNKTKKLWLYIPIPLDSKLSDAWLFGTKWIQANELKF